MNGWKPMKTMQVVNWYDHGQERFNPPSGHERVERHEPDLLLREG